MQSWQKYFLNEVKKFGICAHQCDDVKMCPSKRVLNTQYYQSKIKEYKNKLELFQNNDESLMKEYAQYAHKLNDEFNKELDGALSKINEQKQILKKIESLELNRDSVEYNAQSSCISQLKNSIVKLQEEYVRTKNPFVIPSFGSWKQCQYETLTAGLKHLEETYEYEKRAIVKQNEQIEQIYKSIGLNYSDFENKKLFD